MKLASRRSVLLSSEFLTLVLGSVVLALVGPLVIAVVVYGPIEDDLLDQSYVELEQILERTVADDGGALVAKPASFESRLNDVSKLYGVRLSVIDAGNRIVFDTQGEAVIGAIGARTEEIQAARAQAIGRGRRALDLSSEVENAGSSEWLFVAQRVGSEGATAGYVRVGRSMSGVLDSLEKLRQAVRLGALIALVGALAFIVWGTWQWWAPLRSLTGFARALAREHKVATAPVHVGAFGRLGRALVALDNQASVQIAALSRDDAQLRAILTSMLEGILAVDQKDRVVFANGAVCSILGLEGPVVDESLWACAPIVELEEIVRAARENKRPERREVISLRTGSERIILMHASPFESDADSGVVVVTQDLTELRHLERVRRDFVANVSHELKTPLTAIVGYVDTLLEGDVDGERQTRFLQRVQANASRLRALVGDLLSLARIESGDGITELVATDWAGVLDAVYDRAEDKAAAKPLRLERAGETTLRVLGDHGAMTQILENLVDNALKYAPAGGLVRVSLRRIGSVGRLAVEDSGNGIPDEDQERIFERFYRVDKAHSLAVGGTGLGLSIVKNLTLAMKGDVRLKSSMGKGTRFEVDLPLAD